MNALTDNLREKKQKAIMTLRPGTGYELPKNGRARFGEGNRDNRTMTEAAEMRRAIP